MRAGSWRAGRRKAYGISERHAAKLVRLAISTLRYRSSKVFDEVLRCRLSTTSSLPNIWYGRKCWKSTGAPMKKLRDLYRKLAK